MMATEPSRLHTGGSDCGATGRCDGSRQVAGYVYRRVGCLPGEGGRSVQALGEAVDRERRAMGRWQQTRLWLGPAAAFLVGGIPFSNIAARLTRGVDLRGVA